MFKKDNVAMNLLHKMLSLPPCATGVMSVSVVTAPTPTSQCPHLSLSLSRLRQISGPGSGRSVSRIQSRLRSHRRQNPEISAIIRRWLVFYRSFPYYMHFLCDIRTYKIFIVLYFCNHQRLVLTKMLQKRDERERLAAAPRLLWSTAPGLNS